MTTSSTADSRTSRIRIILLALLAAALLASVALQAYGLATDEGAPAEAHSSIVHDENKRATTISVAKNGWYTITLPQAPSGAVAADVRLTTSGHQFTGWMRVCDPGVHGWNCAGVDTSVHNFTAGQYPIGSNFTVGIDPHKRFRLYVFGVGGNSSSRVTLSIDQFMFHYA